MEGVIKLDTVGQYDEIFGLETLHPLVNVIDLDRAKRWPTRFTFNYGVYALFLKDVKCGDIRYGRQVYDYQEGTVVGFAPGQVATMELAENVRLQAHGVIFHPDLIKGTSLGQNIRQYSFFSYNSTEALHLSENEKEIFMDCLHKVETELHTPIDKHSKRLISRNIELLLDYCMRFYERQFVTRSTANRDVLSRFETLLDDYFHTEQPQNSGLPTVKYFADKLCLSPNYFGDLLKKETGKSPQEHIQGKIIDLAKEMIAGTDKPLNQIAYELGFQYSQHFTRLFKKNTGCTPGEYRHAEI